MYKVEHKFTYGWDDAGWQEGNEPWLFATRREAQEEINLLCSEMGYSTMGYDPSDFRVVKA